ncbi:MAG: LacI family transcriptional regulator [Treponema sp.]|nr:LacI family transcriptional regulator [Treponema sp.]
MTLTDIAKECGVSMMTVSNVINKKYKKVSQETVKKVNAVIEKYDFVPNRAACTLSSNCSHLVLLVYPSINVSNINSLYTEYLTNLTFSIERELMENGYYVMINYVDEIKEIDTIFKTWNIDGAIFLLPYFNKTVSNIKDLKKRNFVLIDSYDDIKGVSVARCDDESGTYLSTKTLIDAGHKKIIFAADYKGNRLLERRHAGYKRALEEAGIEYEECLSLPVIPNYEGGLEFGKTLTKEKMNFTGIVTTSDMCALGIIDGAKEKGIFSPEDYSIIGFDNLSVCNYCSPKLTSVNQNITEKGRQAVRMLLNKIEGKTEDEVFSSKTQVILRNSVKKL